MGKLTYEEQLAGIPPHLWKRTLERAAVIDRYLHIPRPSTAEADAFAEKLGISRRFFYKLVRIFEERRAAPVPPIKAQYSSGRIEQPSERVITTVIADLGVDARLSDIVNETQLRCNHLQIPMPSGSAIRMRFNAARLINPSSKDLATIVIDHCGLLLPIEDQEATRTAVITTVIHPGTGLIFGHYVDVHPPGPAAVRKALMDALTPHGSSKRGSREKVEIAYERNDQPGWDSLERAISSAGIKAHASKATPRSAGRTLMRIVGTRLGRIYLAPRSTFTPKSSFRGGGPPVSLDQARATIREIVEQRNIALNKELVLQGVLGARKTTALRVALQDSL